MKKALFLLLIVVLLAMSASVALAKPGQHMTHVCWVDSQGREQHAYFMRTGSGLVHRWKMDGKHDIYKPFTAFAEMPEASGWSLYTGKAQAACDPASTPGFNDFVEDGVIYWHWHN